MEGRERRERERRGGKGREREMGRGRGEKEGQGEKMRWKEGTEGERDGVKEWGELLCLRTNFPTIAEYPS